MQKLMCSAVVKPLQTGRWLRASTMDKMDYHCNMLACCKGNVLTASYWLPRCMESMIQELIIPLFAQRWHEDLWAWKPIITRLQTAIFLTKSGENWVFIISSCILPLRIDLDRLDILTCLTHKIMCPPYFGLRQNVNGNSSDANLRGCDICSLAVPTTICCSSCKILICSQEISFSRLLLEIVSNKYFLIWLNSVIVYINVPEK